MAEVPKRVVWAVRQLDVQPDDRILEVGCGDGSALSLITPQLKSGTIVGVDRSPLAIRSARKRNEAGLKGRKLTLVESELADLGIEGGFSKVFALNVNVFWHRPKRELAVVRDLLTGDGRLLLMFEPPAADQIAQIAELTRRNLEANDFDIESELRTSLSASSVLRITATPAR